MELNKTTMRGHEGQVNKMTPFGNIVRAESITPKSITESFSTS